MIRWAHLVLIGAFGLPTSTLAAIDCFERLDVGSQAQVDGRLPAAYAIFTAALRAEPCQSPPHASLLRFSLGRVLLEMAEQDPEKACEARSHLELARQSAMAQVAEGAAALFEQASSACLTHTANADDASGKDARQPGPAPDAPPREPEPPEPDKLAPGARATPPAEDEQPREENAPNTASETIEARPDPVDGKHADEAFQLGPRLESGFSGLAFGRIDSTEVTPGATLGLGLALEYRLSEALALLVEPTASLVSLNVTFDHPGALPDQTAVWRRILLESTAGLAWFPRGGDVSMRFGLRGGWVLDAAEKASLLGGDAWAIDLAPFALDAVIGLGWSWRVDATRLRLSADGGFGLLRFNSEDDTTGWLDYRVGLAVAALF